MYHPMNADNQVEQLNATFARYCICIDRGFKSWNDRQGHPRSWKPRGSIENVYDFLLMSNRSYNYGSVSHRLRDISICLWIF